MANETVLDPVCDMSIDPSKTAFVSDYEGMRYYFCSQRCKLRFDDDPVSFLEPDLTATDAVD
ncbi:MAG: YHS domain-containing protein [Acidobacteriaceae bacterium]|nr:YHS domain-containing protein [Acidobacteriaceae bacterium]